MAWRRSASVANPGPPRLQPSAPLDPHRADAVDEHLVDLGVAQQRLERPEPERELGHPVGQRGPRAPASRTAASRVDERPDGRRVAARLPRLGDQALAQAGREVVQGVVGVHADPRSRLARTLPPGGHGPGARVAPALPPSPRRAAAA